MLSALSNVNNSVKIVKLVLGDGSGVGSPPSLHKALDSIPSTSKEKKSKTIKLTYSFDLSCNPRRK
jgi:hypothetical protein